MNKTSKFRPELAELVLSGKKTSTWRLWDDKNISEGDILDLLNKETLEKFATAKVTKVVEKPLGSLTPEEKGRHEVYTSDEEMFNILEGFYHKPVNSDTLAKVIWFELLD